MKFYFDEKFPDLKVPREIAAKLAFKSAPTKELLLKPFPFASNACSVIFSGGRVLQGAFHGKGAHTNVLREFGKTSTDSFDGTFAGVKETDAIPALAWKTADCLAIAMTAKLGEHLFVAVVHAGWRGFAGGIHLKAVKECVTFAESVGVAERDALNAIEVKISPAIFGAVYPCGPEVGTALEKRFEMSEVAPFEKSWSALAKVCLNIPVSAPEPFKVYPDLQLAACCDFLSLNLNPDNIEVFRVNTFGHPLLHSYRCATQRGENFEARGKRIVTHLVGELPKDHGMT